MPSKIKEQDIEVAWTIFNVKNKEIGPQTKQLG